MRQALHDTDSFIKFQNFVFLLYLSYGIRLSGYPVIRLSGYPAFLPCRFLGVPEQSHDRLKGLFI